MDDDKLKAFLKEICDENNYGPCLECSYSSSKGCMHPLHPRNNPEGNKVEVTCIACETKNILVFDKGGVVDPLCSKCSNNLEDYVIDLAVKASKKEGWNGH